MAWSDAPSPEKIIDKLIGALSDYNTDYIVWLFKSDSGWCCRLKNPWMDSYIGCQSINVSSMAYSVASVFIQACNEGIVVNPLEIILQ